MSYQEKIGMIPQDIKMHGSTFLRLKGVVDTSDDFEVWSHGVKYDSIILQKALWEEILEVFKGPKILDICDPEWGEHDKPFVKVAGLADAITCSSEQLTNYVKQIFPQKYVFHVPDRLNFNLFPPSRPKHLGRAHKVAWFGYIHNAYQTLKPMLPIIKNTQLDLTIISNKEYEFKEDLDGINVNYIKYSHDVAYRLLRDFDIILNPKSNHPKFKYKSNNKTIIGWKLGVPVAETTEQLLDFLDPDARNIEVEAKLPIVEKEYNIVDSAEQYRKIIKLIRENPEV